MQSVLSSDDEGPEYVAPAHIVRLSTRLSQTLESARTEGELETDLEELKFGEGEEDLLRASRLTTVMKGWSSIFANSEGSALTYDMSSLVEKIDIFISHNWVVDRWRKHIVLSHHFNQRVAVSFALLVLISIMVFFATAVAVGWDIPDFLFVQSAYEDSMARRSSARRQLGVDADESPRKDPLRSSWLARLVVPLCYMATLLFWQDIKHCFGYTGPFVFLDKTCIHQVDKEKQRQGIEKLGAFIRRSEQMVVVYSTTYLSKLWTVYELACFLLVHRLEALKVLPVSRASNVLVLCFLCFSLAVWCMVGEVIVAYEFDRYGIEVVVFFYLLIYSQLIRRWLDTRHNVWVALRNFTVQDCTCFAENDRPVVYGNITKMMRERLNLTIEENDALMLFDLTVRKDVPGRLLKTMPRMCIKYHGWVTLLTLCLVGPHVADWMPRQYHKVGWLGVFLEIFTGLELIFSHIPISMAIITRWAEMCSECFGYQQDICVNCLGWSFQVLFITMGTLFLILVGGLKSLGLKGLQENIEELIFQDGLTGLTGDPQLMEALIVYFAYILSEFVVTIFMFRLWRYCRCRKRRKKWEETVEEMEIQASESNLGQGVASISVTSKSYANLQKLKEGFNERKKAAAESPFLSAKSAKI